MRNDFAVFILTNGRPNKVVTYNSLKKSNYTGNVFIVVDDKDDTLLQYKKKFGDMVIVFSKDNMAKTFDEGDNFNDRRSIVYARNACFDIAKKLGVTYFIQLDDDYTSFIYKFDEKLAYRERPIKNLDAVFSALLRFYIGIDALTITMAQNGDFIGGKNSTWAKDVKLHRKAMNTFICSIKRPFQFIGRINEDVNTYVNMGSKGSLMMTVPNIAIIQRSTQKTKGGMTELYLDGGTYLKSLYSVMINPSCVKIAKMGQSHKRLHHKVAWNNAVPKIISEDYRASA